MAVGLLQEIRNEIRLVSMMESSDWEFELVCELKTWLVRIIKFLPAYTYPHNVIKIDCFVAMYLDLDSSP